MTDPTTELFERLGRVKHEARLAAAEGTIRFDLVHDQQTDHWLVAIQRGDLSVSRNEREADCVVSTNKGLFDLIATGKENAIACMLRADMIVDGNLQLLVLLERLLPGPPEARGPQRVAGEGRRQS